MIFMYSSMSILSFIVGIIPWVTPGAGALLHVPRGLLLDDALLVALIPQRFQ